MPADLVGDYLINEPVARIIRRAKVINVDGKTHLENAYDRKEFIASTDFYFRPVNTYTGPDGLVYIVDMSRGIIQESNWTRKGTFLRGKIEEYDIAKIKQRGRIWRLVHDDFKPGPKPKMLDVPAASLVAHLDHPNGWWRDNAQKQIVILGDKSVVPTLKQMSTGKKKVSALGRLHALWTLEGLDAIDKSVLYTAMKDDDPQIRRAAIWLSERYINQNDNEVIAKVGKLAKDKNYDVKTQVLLSLGASKNELSKKIVGDMLSQNPNNEMLNRTKSSVDKNELAKAYGAKLAGFNGTEKRWILNGAEIYQSMCSPCHGEDGKGLPTQAAPALRGAKHINADKAMAIRILLHGLTGPIEGKTYPSDMVSMADNNDEWISSVLSFVRFEFVGPKIQVGKESQSAVIRPGDVKALRVQHANVTKPWTIKELEKLADTPEKNK